MAGIFTIPAGLPFADLVACHVLETYSNPDPLGLCRVTILVPSRRAVGTLREAFLRTGDGRVMLLPAIRSIADGAAEMPGLAGITGAAAGAEEPPPVDPLQRQLLIARLIRDWAESEGGADQIDLARAFLLSGDLADLIDELHTEGIAPQALRSAAPEDFSDRWQVAMGLLSIAIDAWPAEKARLGICDPAEGRDRQLRAYADALASDPPDLPVIVAGSTGSIPAAAELLTVIGGLPAGMVILPGLDQALDRPSWQAVGPEHPQSAMKRLLDDHLKIDRAAVKLWPGVDPEQAHSRRQKLVSDLLRPAATTEHWLAGGEGPGPPPEGALAGLSLIEAPGQREEAQIIALALRGVLEIPERTAALVTPDRALAVRVAAGLRRWGIEIDDSGGTPLGLTPRGAFLLLLAEAAESGYAPVPLLSMLKHPMAAGGQAPAEFRRRARILERSLLHGPRPARGLDGMLNALASKAGRLRVQAKGETRLAMIEDARALVTGLTVLLAPLSGLAADRKWPVEEAFAAVAEAAENMAATNQEPGAERMWAGRDGNAGFAMVDLFSAPSGGQTVAASGMVQILRAAMAGTTVRAAFDLHPRIHIWGTPEARMQQTDLVILGGLNEGVWPALPKVDVWLNRPMRARAGLASPERRIGLAAHDFAQGLAAPEVMLTRSRKIDGTPQVAARWLFRLESFVSGMFGKEAFEGLKCSPLPAWAEALDRPAHAPRPAARPRPKPPLSARPKQLSVTRIETWIRDPYALYAREILKLRPLDPIDQDPSFLERGIIVHKVFERFVEATRSAFPAPGEAELLLSQIIEEELAAISDFPAAQAFWRQRVLRAGDWFIDFEATRRQDCQPLALEAKARLVLETGAGAFTLTATADRIDRGPHGLEILDYKTGAAPSAKQVCAGISPQLPLEALILTEGGFEDLPPSPVGALAYIELKGGGEPGKYKAVAGAGDVAEIIAKAKSGLIGRIEQFADPQMPYDSRLHPIFSQQAGDYDHLARVREWSLAGAAEDGE